MREALFAILGELNDVRVLDLYAGTGALGIEALSRGAQFAVFVERAGASLEALDANLADLGLDTRSRVVRGDALRAVRRLGKQAARFDLVLADPPYDAAVEGLLEALVGSRILNPGGTLVIERRRGHAVTPVDGLVLVEHREYGDTVLSRLEASMDAGG